MSEKRDTASLYFMIAVWTTLFVLWVLHVYDKDTTSLKFKTTDEISHGSP